MGRFRTGIINWTGKRVLFSDIGGGLPRTRISSKMKSPKASQSKLWRGEIHQGNPEVLDIGNWPQTQ